MALTKEQEDKASKLGKAGLAAATGAGLMAGGAGALAALGNKQANDPRFTVKEADKTRAAMLRSQLKSAQSPISETEVEQKADKVYEGVMGEGQKAQTQALRAGLSGALPQERQLDMYKAVAEKGMEERAKALGQGYEQAAGEKRKDFAAAQDAITKETAELRKARTAKWSQGMKIGGVVIDKLSEAGFLDDALGVVGGAIGGTVGGPGGAALGKTLGTTAGDLIQGSEKDKEKEEDKPPVDPTVDVEEEEEKPEVETEVEPDRFSEDEAAIEDEEEAAENVNPAKERARDRMEERQRKREEGVGEGDFEEVEDEPLADQNVEALQGELKNAYNLPEIPTGSILVVDDMNQFAGDIFGIEDPGSVNAVYIAAGVRPPNPDEVSPEDLAKAKAEAEKEGSAFNVAVRTLKDAFQDDSDDESALKKARIGREIDALKEKFRGTN